MSESETQTTRLWTPEGFRDDEWMHAESADELGGGRIILPLAAFLAFDRAVLAQSADRIGVAILSGESVEAILPFLETLPLISLAFPAFNDGRSYSKAQLLRGRHGYKGVIRACGDVLIDQISLMLRTGFDEFEVSNETALRRLAEGRIGGLPFHYQPAAKEAVKSGAYSWRRMPAA
jgi:uncharacterized protein (DUF934 family)